MRFAARGSCERIESSLVRTSKPAASTSVPQSKAICEVRRILARARVDLLDARKRRERVFDRLRDELFDFLGRRARIGDGHAHEGEGDVRELLERQQARGDEADHRHRRERHQRGDGSAQREVRVDHAGSGAACSTRS